MRSDFVGIIEPVSDQIQGLSASTRIEGVGRVRWSLRDSANKICTIETCAYYIPEASIRLFSPQVYFQENEGGSLVLTQDGVVFTTANGTPLYFCYQVGNNLPMAPPPSLESSNKILGNFSYAELNQERVALSLFEESNQILSMSQKELLLWHNCLGHADMKLIQGLIQDNILKQHIKVLSLVPYLYVLLAISPKCAAVVLIVLLCCPALRNL